ncbi:MAG: LCP family protein [Chloroflexi bacterium]|nr:LCP family protein [Chloroflexota bacterium]
MKTILDVLKDSLKNVKFPKWQKLPVRQMIFWGVVLAVTVGLFFFARSFTACWRLTSLSGIPPSACPGSAVNPLGTPVVNDKGTPVDTSSLPPTPDLAAPVVQYPQWDGGSRINVVFFGLRGGDIAGEDCPQCTDTIILLTVDPVTKTAGMLSIPRDMWVNIPGFGFSRINTAWTDGEGAKLPGGGPGLAMKTVSQFIGVPVQYYIQVDFETFISFINMIGGIDIYSDEKLVLDPIGSGTDKFVITCCGMRHLDGKRALAYARTRKTSDGDVDRAKRQQKVILAVRDKVFSPQYFPKLMAQAPQLYNMFSAGIRTNMSLDDAIKLAVLAKDISIENIKQGVIDNSMVTFGNVTLGGQNASILKPIPDKIRVLRDLVFTSGGPVSPIAQGDAVALMKADGARVVVANNTYTAQLDARTANFLIAQGMNVVGLGQPSGVSDQTTVVIYSPKLYALRYIISTFGIASSNQIIFKNDPASPMDIEIRIGNNWVSKIPAGY